MTKRFSETLKNEVQRNCGPIAGPFFLHLKLRVAGEISGKLVQRT
jgi:hypothetical protein